MMKLLKSKKADLKFILRAALVVFLLVIITSITLNAVNRYRDSTDDCIGTCRASCGVGEVRYSSNCYRDGEEVEGLVCCTGGLRGEDEEPIEPPTETGDADEETEEVEETEEDVEEEQELPEDIEIIFTKGEDYPVPQSDDLILGKKYDFKVKTKGDTQQISECEIIFIDSETKSKLEETGDFKHITKDGHCEEEFTITPTEEDLKEFPESKFIIQIRLTNEEGERIAYKNYHFTIRQNNLTS